MISNRTGRGAQVPQNLQNPGGFPAPSAGEARPLFGEIAGLLHGVPEAAIDAALLEQTRSGGKIGEHLVRCGRLTWDQVYDVLSRQARQEAEALAKSAGAAFPVETFLSVAYPAFNEQDNIRDTIRAGLVILPEFVSSFELIVVDDGSTDETGAIVEELSREDGRIRLIRHPTNVGYGGAVASALRAARGDLILMSDSDGQFSLLDAAPFLVDINDHDVVIGYRHPRADSRIRLLNAWAWNQVVSRLLKIRVRDLDCAFKMFRREVVDRLSMTATGACISAELMVQVSRGGWRLKELPVRHFGRSHGLSTGANLRVIARALREIPKLLAYRRSCGSFPPVESAGAANGARFEAPESVSAQEVSLSDAPGTR